MASGPSGCACSRIEEVPSKARREERSEGTRPARRQVGSPLTMHQLGQGDSQTRDARKQRGGKSYSPPERGTAYNRFCRAPTGAPHRAHTRLLRVKGGKSGRSSLSLQRARVAHLPDSSPGVGGTQTTRASANTLSHQQAQSRDPYDLVPCFAGV